MTVARREKRGITEDEFVIGANGTICIDQFIVVKSKPDKDTLDERREVMG